MPRDTVFEECPERTRDFIPCGCKAKCMLPTEDEFRRAHAADTNLVVMGGRVLIFTPGVSYECHGDGTEIQREIHFDGRPTKVTTCRNGRRKITYEKP